MPKSVSPFSITCILLLLFAGVFIVATGLRVFISAEVSDLFYISRSIRLVFAFVINSVFNWNINNLTYFKVVNSRVNSF